MSGMSRTTDTRQRVILLHALGSSHRMFRAQDEALSDQYDLVIPDLPGHGAAPPGFSLDRAVDQVRGLIADSGRPAHLVGVSMSATIALLVALRDPGQVRSLLLSGATVRPSRVAVRIQRAVMAVLPIAVSARMSARIVGPADDRDREALVSDVAAAGKKTQAQVLRGLVGTDLTAQLRRVSVPTLVCCGERDTANLPAARLISENVPGATLRVVPGGGHLWNLEQPDECTKLIDEFVSSLA